MAATLEVQAGASLRQPMSYEQYQTLGETKHIEFYDGLAVMNPPNRRHAIVASRLTRLLQDAAPAHHLVLAEWGWQVGPMTVCEPDIMVFAADAPGEDLLRVAPLLAIEVTSPSTRSEDWHRKRELYAQGGAAWYWIVEPDEWSLTLLRNDGGAFEEVARGDHGVHQVTDPFPVNLDLDDLFA